MRRGAPIPIVGRTVAVTGGARGIGRAIADEVARRGGNVIVGDLEGGDLPLDVTDRDSFAAFLEAAGEIDVLVNNAGVLHVGPFLETSQDWIRRQVDINFVGVINGMQLALPAMVARRRGHVVNVASSASKIGVRYEAVYAGTKHAVYGLTESVRYELRGSGVHLTAVLPGLVNTDLASGTLSAKGVKVIGPEAVARGVGDALERPRNDVFVPREYAVLATLVSALPSRVRGPLLRAVGAERATATANEANRAAYEERMRAMTGRRSE